MPSDIFIRLGASNVTVEVVYLAEITQSATCDAEEGISLQNIAHVLTAQYIINSVNNDNDSYFSRLSVPNVTNGEHPNTNK